MCIRFIMRGVVADMQSTRLQIPKRLERTMSSQGEGQAVFHLSSQPRAVHARQSGFAFDLCRLGEGTGSHYFNTFWPRFQGLGSTFRGFSSGPEDAKGS